MLSRRNIRVKVMQALYSIESMNNETRPGEPLQILKKNIEHSQHLFTYLVYYIIEVARYAEKDAAQKAQKHLPSVNDLNINTKIAGNEIIWAIIENTSFQKSVENFKINYSIDDELVRKAYLVLVTSPEYKAVSYTHLRAHETDSYLVCRLLLEKKKKNTLLKKKNKE